ncbi:hypothetical protein ACMYR3_06255 [Ampullimonas aquatilis]|uniref:hypothetical protein n=1 Tax=Ampullimonas aquatilis TaxID=1341549 RepID=UPI003C74E1A2
MKRDIYRSAQLIIIATLFITLSSWTSLLTRLHLVEFSWVLFMLGQVFLFLLVQHWGRRVIIPQVNLQQYFNKAYSENSIGAGLCVVGVCILIAAILLVCGVLIK